MPAVLALLDHRGALASLRRGLARGRSPLVACRTAVALEAALTRRWVDAIVLGVRQAQQAGLPALRERFPAIPLVAYGVLRADDADVLVSWQRLGIAAVVVAGVDDAVVGELVARHTASAVRRRALREAPRLLRLTEPIQLLTWEILVEQPGLNLSTAVVAERLGISREHLSRQFGAGGAPNLKRVVDCLRIMAAAELATNPGYDRATVARLAGFTSPAHLHTASKRIAGLGIQELPGKDAEWLLGRFMRVGMRSRGG
jgi:AraC-like DNA-binding protein